MNKAEKLRKLAAEFNDDDSFTSGYRFRWDAISMYRRWCLLTGDYRSAEAVERFMKFMESNDAS